MNHKLAGEGPKCRISLKYFFDLEIYNSVHTVKVKFSNTDNLLTPFFCAGLILYAVNQYFVHILLQVTDKNQQRGENDWRNYFVINLHKRYR